MRSMLPTISLLIASPCALFWVTKTLEPGSASREATEAFLYPGQPSIAEITFLDASHVRVKTTGMQVSKSSGERPANDEYVFTEGSNIFVDSTSPEEPEFSLYVVNPETYSQVRQHENGSTALMGATIPLALETTAIDDWAVSARIQSRPPFAVTKTRATIDECVSSLARWLRDKVGMPDGASFRLTTDQLVREVDRGRSRIWCDGISSIGAAFLTSRGFPARVVRIDSQLPIGKSAHACIEVYDGAIHHWRLVDLALEVSSFRTAQDSKPLNVLDLQRLIQSETGRRSLVTITEQSGERKAVPWKELSLERKCQLLTFYGEFGTAIYDLHPSQDRISLGLIDRLSRRLFSRSAFRYTPTRTSGDLILDVCRGVTLVALIIAAVAISRFIKQVWIAARSRPKSSAGREVPSSEDLITG